MATLITRRHGTRLGGLVATLPAVGGPIILVFAIQQGHDFAADASAAALLGVVALNAFIVVYCWVALRAGWRTSLATGWLAYLVMVAAFYPLRMPLLVMLALAWLSSTLTLRVLPKVEPRSGDAPIPPEWDISMRSVAAVALIAGLTAIAAALGPELSGLLTPFPVIATVLSAFTHAHDGVDEAIRVMRGFAAGLFAFASFFFVVAATLRELTTASAFVLALTVTVLVQLAMLIAGNRRAVYER